MNSDTVESLLQNVEGSIFRPEVVSPSADAMGFVYGYHRDARGRQHPQGRRPYQPFGGYIEQLQMPCVQIGEHLLPFCIVHHTVQTRGAYSALPESLHLILHERNQRGYDNRHAVATESGRLITERFATARRQHDDRILIAHRGLHGLPLKGQEIAVAPIGPQGRPERGMVAAERVRISHRTTFRIAGWAYNGKACQSSRAVAGSNRRL